MKLCNNRLLAATLLLVAVLASPASSQCVSGTMTAEFQGSGEFAGLWRYTVAITWDTEDPPNHITLDCGLGLCPDVACAQSWVFGFPAGVSTGELGDLAALEKDCRIEYSGAFNCDGDSSIGLTDPAIKWEPADTAGCETERVGSGTFWFYVNLPPHPDSETPIILIKNGQNLCQGAIVGDCPAVCPGGDPTIQAGVNATEEGDTLEIDAGTYTGVANRAIFFEGKDIVVKSKEGAEETIIDCEGITRGFDINGDEPPTAVLDGFTIMNGDPDQPGVAIRIGPQGSNLTIRNMRICDNTSTSNLTGIVAVEAGSPLFENVLFDQNTATEANGVIWTRGDPIFNDCMIKDNTTNTCVVVESGAPQFNGTSIMDNVARQQAVLVGSSASFDECTINNNSADGMRLLSGAAPATVMNCDISSNAGVGVAIMENSSALSGCTITQNQDGGVVHGLFKSALPTGSPSQSSLLGLPLPLLAVTTPSQPTITDAIISGNISTTSSGGGIRFSCADTPEMPYLPTYINCTITGNSSFFDGGGVNVCGNAIDADISPIFIGCTIASNSAGGVGGGINAEVNVGGAQSSIDLDQTIMWGNCATGVGGTLFAVSGNVVTFDCCDVDVLGVTGEGTVSYGEDVIFSDPTFCDPAACGNAPTAQGDFQLSPGSGASEENSPCGVVMGAQAGPCSPVTAIGDLPGQPSRTALLPTVPNPFNPSTTIRFDLAESAYVTLHIYDALGRQVRTLVDRQMTGAQHTFVWHGTDDSGKAVATGVYFLRFSAGHLVETSKLVLLK